VLTAVAACILLASPASAPGALADPNPDAVAQARFDRITHMGLADLAREIAAGRISSEEAVGASLDRIGRIDRAGPQLKAVLTLNPDALAEARRMDEERRAGRMRGPLHGVPVLIKDNIETRDNMPTTAGSPALAQNFVGRDAALVARLRAAGAVILGKTNMSEWAGFRDSNSVSGWSGVGGQTLNPYALDRSPCGSSAGSAVAVAAEFVAGAIGTETNGSISCPASMNGIVGFKPTRGLISVSGVVPVAVSQDTPGPFAREVRDVALLTGVMAEGARDFASGLDGGALRGRRVGLPVAFLGDNQQMVDLVVEAKRVLERAGAEVVLIQDGRPGDELRAAERAMVLAEMRTALGGYLATTAPRVRVRSLEDLIAFNEREEDAPFGQNILKSVMQSPGMEAPAYAAAKAQALRLSQDGLERLMAAAHVDVIVAPTQGPAFIMDPILGDHLIGSGVGSAGWLAAIAGWPHLSVPMGEVDGLPVGLSFVGRAGADAQVLSAGFAYERASRARIAPTYAASVAAMRASPGGRRSAP
jgi:amidase